MRPELHRDERIQRPEARGPVLCATVPPCEILPSQVSHRATEPTERLALFVLVAWGAAMFLSPTARGEDALDIFRQRITPILSAKRPSSCSECHLSGVDLKQYIGATQEETFANLRDGGLIDVKNPDASKILKFIARRPEKPSLVSAQVRQQEYEAFRAWIAAAVKDPKLAAARTGDAKLGPQIPDEVIRHARADRVLASFIDNVWSEVGRCAACHSPDRNQKQVKEHGEQMSWIKLGDPQATLNHLLENELIGVESPEKSLILLKPTNQEKHGGGVKMTVGDRTYKQFRAFLDDYAAAVKGRYRTAADLPPPSGEVSSATELWLKLTDVPEEFDQQVLRVDLYRWDSTSKSWSKERWASGDRPVFGKGKLWQQHLSVIAPRKSPRAAEIRTSPQLPPGKYLAKIYVDRTDKLARHYPAELDEGDLVGQVEFESRWPEGYQQMTVVRFP